MPSQGQKWAIGGVAALAVHFSGAVAGIEHEMSPSLARTTLNLFGELQPEWKAGVTAVKEYAQGSDSQKIAARATCTYLNAVNSTSPFQETNKERILSYIPLSDRSLPGVEAAAGSIATKLTGATQPGAAGHIYREACFGIG